MPNRSPYFYNITGERARELLFLYGCKGQFLVRPSESNPTDHTLSVHRGTRVTHVKIPSINGFHKLPTGEEFSSLTEIVQYIVRTPNLLSEKDGTFIELTSPVVIPPSENVINVGYDRFFHINISGSEAEELLKDEPNGTYLVRESTSNPGEYALSVKNDDAILHIRIYHSDAKFRVVPKDNFRSIADLLDNYIRLPMVQNGGNAVRLKTPLQSTRFTAAAIDDRIDCLVKSARKPNAKDGFVEEFENRYRNVVPYDHTRIKLTLRAEESQNDYINANFIEILSHNTKYAEFAGYEKRRYISTQGCLQETVGDFWHMIWQENSTIIVMITKEVERGRIKCFRYWPDLDKEQVFTFYDEEFVIKTELEREAEDFTIRTFSLLNREKGTETRRIHHFQFLGWEDNGCPSDSILHFLDEVNNCVETSRKTKPTVSGPIVVHCSAGIGRTGTFIVLDMLINRIKKIGPSTPIDITKTVRMLREQRATMVQTEAQYRFICEPKSFLAKCQSLKVLDLAISAFMNLRRTQIQNDHSNAPKLTVFYHVLVTGAEQKELLYAISDQGSLCLMSKDSDPSSALPSPSPLGRKPAPCFQNLTINGANNVSTSNSAKQL